MACRLPAPVRWRAGYTGEAGKNSGEAQALTPFFFPCCSCGSDAVEIVGYLGDEDAEYLIQTKGSVAPTPALYCGPCWEAEVVPLLDPSQEWRAQMREGGMADA